MAREREFGLLRVLLRSPELVARTWTGVRDDAEAPVTEREVTEALVQFEALWEELFPAEQARIVQLLVTRVDVQPDGIEVALDLDGLRSLIEELRQQSDSDLEAA